MCKAEKTKSMKRTGTMTLAALFLALGLVLPFLTGQIPSIGSMLLPMHIPVLLCGFVCGWQYGLMVGFILPLFRSFLFGMPPMMPTAIAMAFELAAYGLICGLLYHRCPACGRIGKGVRIYIALIVAMLGGRIIWGTVSILLYGIQGNAFTWQLFMGGALLNAIPGIVLQLVLVPAIVMILGKARLIEENE